MRNKSMIGRRRVIAAAVVAIGLLAPYAAQADINIVGSTHGQNYQGTASPVAGQPAASIPLSLCEVGGSTPVRYQNAVVNDLTAPAIVIPAGNIVVWRCRKNGNDNFLFRYTGGFSAMAYANIKAPLGSDASKFTSIVPGGTSCSTLAAKTDPGTGLAYLSSTGCSQLELVSADFATSDTKGTAFSPSMCDPQTIPSCAQPITDTGVVSFPITATPFAVVVGNGVQVCGTDGPKSGAGKIKLTRVQVEAIFNGSISSWNQLGYCVYGVDALSPADATLPPSTGELSVGKAFNAGIDQSIVTCSRPVTAGTRIIFDATMMKDSAEVSGGTIGGGSPYVQFVGDFNYLAPTVANGLECIQGSQSGAATITPGNMNAIGYMRADESAPKNIFTLGNVGRMRGGYPVTIDGILPSDYTAPTNPADPAVTERANSQKQFRCGRYAFWSDWVGIQRTVPNANQALWNSYVSQIAALLPKTTTGYFWSRNLRQSGQPVNTEMFVQKGETKGPVTWNPGDPSACHGQ